MESRYLIDSNVIIDFLAARLPDPGNAFVGRIIDEVPNLSVITKIEILGFSNSPIVQSMLQSLIDSSLVFQLADQIIEKTIELRKRIRIKIPDAIIASTALSENMVLMTHNAQDFKNIPNLAIIDPWSI